MAGLPHSPVTVSGAIAVAAALDISEAFVAVIIIGLGTSLPELSISVGAAIKKRARMSVGNLVGSNIFDTLIPIGLGCACLSSALGSASRVRGDAPGSLASHPARHEPCPPT